MLKQPIQQKCCRIIRHSGLCFFVGLRQISDLANTNTSFSHINENPSNGNIEKDIKNTNRKNEKGMPLIKIPSKQLLRTHEIGSIVVSLREIACATMTRDLNLTSWQRFPIFDGKSGKSTPLRTDEYYRRISESIEAFQVMPDLWILENRFWKLSVAFLSSHFLTAKTVLHCLLSEKYKENRTNRVVYAPWNQTGYVFDLMVKGANSRKSGKEKVIEILQSGEWSGSQIILPSNLVTITESDILVKKKINNDEYHEKISEEMSDSFLQALAFWTTLKDTSPQSS